MSEIIKVKNIKIYRKIKIFMNIIKIINEHKNDPIIPA